MSLGKILQTRLSRRSGLKAAGASLLTALFAGVPWTNPGKATASSKHVVVDLVGEEFTALVAAAHEHPDFIRLLEFVGEGRSPVLVEAKRGTFVGVHETHTLQSCLFKWDIGNVLYLQAEGYPGLAVGRVDRTTYVVSEGSVVASSVLPLDREKASKHAARRELANEGQVTVRSTTCDDCNMYVHCSDPNPWCIDLCCDYDPYCGGGCGSDCDSWLWECIMGGPWACMALQLYCVACASLCCTDYSTHCAPWPPYT